MLSGIRRLSLAGLMMVAAAEGLQLKPRQLTAQAKEQQEAARKQAAEAKADRKAAAKKAAADKKAEAAAKAAAAKAEREAEAERKVAEREQAIDALPVVLPLRSEEMAKAKIESEEKRRRAKEEKKKQKEKEKENKRLAEEKKKENERERLDQFNHDRFVSTIQANGDENEKNTKPDAMETLVYQVPDVSESSDLGKKIVFDLSPPIDNQKQLMFRPLKYWEGLIASEDVRGSSDTLEVNDDYLKHGIDSRFIPYIHGRKIDFVNRNRFEYLNAKEGDALLKLSKQPNNEDYFLYLNIVNSQIGFLRESSTTQVKTKIVDGEESPEEGSSDFNQLMTENMEKVNLTGKHTMSAIIKRDIKNKKRSEKKINLEDRDVIKANIYSEIYAMLDNDILKSLNNNVLKVNSIGVKNSTDEEYYLSKVTAKFSSDELKKKHNKKLGDLDFKRGARLRILYGISNLYQNGKEEKVDNDRFFKLGKELADGNKNDLLVMDEEGVIGFIPLEFEEVNYYKQIKSEGGLFGHRLTLHKNHELVKKNWLSSKDRLYDQKKIVETVKFDEIKFHHDSEGDVDAEILFRRLNGDMLVRRIVKHDNVKKYEYVMNEKELIERKFKFGEDKKEFKIDAVTNESIVKTSGESFKSEGVEMPPSERTTGEVPPSREVLRSILTDGRNSGVPTAEKRGSGEAEEEER